MDRAVQLQQRLAQVQGHVDELCAQHDRDPSDVTIIVVTKTWPESDIRHLVSLGVQDMGENKGQELSEKAAKCADLDLRWHFIGQLQTNKAAGVARVASCVHSVDRSRLVKALAKGAADRLVSQPLECLIQISLDHAVGEPDATGVRGGALRADCEELADLILSFPALRLRGVMGVAPPSGDARAAFNELREVSADLVGHHPDATWISAGMSGDLGEAIAAGATHLRIGSAILGERPYLR